MSDFSEGKRMPVTRTEVIEAFRWILGRPPESEEVVQWHLRHQDVRGLRLSLMNSDEFRLSYGRSIMVPNPRMLLVTTTLAAWLLDLDSGRAFQIDAGRGAYCGASFDKNRIYLACRQAAYGAERETQDNIIVCLDRKLRVAGLLRAPRPIRDVHQILYHRGELLVCSTYDDCIFIHNFATGGWNFWQPFGADDASLPDQNHINSVFANDDTIWLVGCKPQGWLATFDRTGKPLGEGKQLLGAMTHNVWPTEQGNFVCSSSEGAILSTSGARLVVNPKAWLRGVCGVGEQLFIGITRELHRDARSAADCSVAAVDAQGHIKRCYSFLGYGMISDIRALNEADPIHNREIFSLEPGAIDDRFLTYETRNTLIDL